MVRSLVSLSLVLCSGLLLSADEKSTTVGVRPANFQPPAVNDVPLPEGLIAGINNAGQMQVQLLDVASVLDSASPPDLAAELRNLKVTLVGLEGISQEAYADDRGMVTFESQIDGWYSLVVADADRAKHAALPVYARSLQKDRTAPLVFPIASVREEVVLRSIRGAIGNPETPLVSLASADAYPISTATFYRVQLSADGSLIGRVIVPLREDLQSWGSMADMNVTIIRSGEVIARTTADADGRFVLSAFEPGQYGVIAAGPLGYAAFAFEVVEPMAVSTVQPVSMRTNAQAVAEELIVVVVPPQLLLQTLDAIGLSYAESGGLAGVGPGPAPGAAGGFAPGAMGGGGGGGGGGGLGELAALAALAAAAAALSDDDDVASPAIP